ncbi:unnamed protein product [Acanthosepion pharaonis]|uniref:DUF7041 domain-containing protein n=1 Tax=Acanthosepion pharaonis TaxID=158019 RepID=A0A812E8G1_ACAPH|nr:unnamed protein product [Sepia pharaonis]
MSKWITMTYLSISLSIYLSISLSIYLSIYLCTESIFQAKHIHSQTARYAYIVEKLPPEIAANALDLLETVPAHNPFDVLKEAIIYRTGKSHERRLHDLFNTTQLGDSCPSQLLRRMKSLLRNDLMSESLFRKLWLDKLPPYTSQILATVPDDLDLSRIAEIADKINEVPSISSVDSTLSDSTTKLSNRGIVSQLISTELRIAVQRDNPIQDILNKFPSLIQPFTYTEPVKHSTVHRIRTTEHPVYSKPRRLAPDKYKIARAVFQHMLDLGIIRPSSSPYASPLYMVTKAQQGAWRPCGDYRRLISQTEPSSSFITYFLPLLLRQPVTLHVTFMYLLPYWNARLLLEMTIFELRRPTALDTFTFSALEQCDVFLCLGERAVSAYYLEFAVDVT